METAADQFKRVGELQESLRTLQFVPHDTRKFDVAGLIMYNGDLGSQFLGMRRFFLSIEEAFLASLEEVERQQISNYASRFRQLLANIHQHTLGGVNSQIHTQATNEFSALYQRLVNVGSTIFISRFVNAESESASLGKSIAEQVNTALSDLRTQSEDLRHRIQTELTQAAVAKNANFFHEEEKRYGWSSVWWGLACVIWFLALITGAAVLALNAEFTGRYLAELKTHVPTMPDQWIVIQVLASKVVVLGAFTYVGVVLVKAFMSVMNAHVTNRHRAVSLDTYKFLLEGAQSDADRQAIIQRAAEAVFGLQETGLIKSVPGSEGGALNTTINLPKLT